ncbi:carbohydrate ABC transporter permease [Streptomyces neyagawaensis]|uniref:carbohydrate ABC transporter permease n=1 Tax=Streptomyces neyagawaensis TaxID=42238 RepID=UPI0006E40153|nr:sugar ABC transporter permease [Streptomyces neyagawaensis]MCL6736395.1 sugar ABC transporter permease [Streptomyces neyagawaensis]MDE1685983.1 sugar ABC transporter permease [Streptomyces neyagawaensis]
MSSPSSTRTASPPRPVPAVTPRVSPAGRPRRTGRRAALTASGFLAPFAVLFLTMMVAPICYAIYQSFFTVRRAGLFGGARSTEFAGLSNYADAFRDHDFIASIVRVVLLGCVQVPVMLGLALLLALLLDSRSARLRKTYRLTFFLPYALPGAIAAVMWSFLLVKDLSPFTGPLSHLGIHTDFLSPSWVPVSIGNMITWGWTGYNMLIIYSALQTIPAEVTEAAALDGCTGWRLAWAVKIPLVRPALVLTTVFSIIGTAQMYTEPAVLVGARIPGVDPKFTPIMNTTLGMDVGGQNLAAAESVVLALITLVLSFGFLKYNQRKGAMA